MDESILEEFAEEGRELLAEAEDALMTLDSGGDPKEVYSSAFRTFHSLKGAAGMMGITLLQNHMHLLEDQFTKFQGKEENIIKHLDYFLEGLDLAGDILSGKEINFKTEAPFKAKEKSQIVVTDPANSVLLISTDENLHQKMVEALIDGRTVFSLREVSALPKFVKINPSIPVIIDSKLKESWLKEPLSKKMNAVSAEINTDDKLVFNNEEVNEKCFFDLAFKEVQLNQLLNKAVSLLMYQFSDLSEYLEKNDKQHILDSLRSEIGEVIKQKKGINGN